MKVAELNGVALDWAVAHCEELKLSRLSGGEFLLSNGDFWFPSTNWAQGGPIIEREGMDLNPHGVDSRSGRTHWRAAIQWLDESDFEGIGSTPLIAAMRCYVASQLGKEVEIPEELK